MCQESASEQGRATSYATTCATKTHTITCWCPSTLRMASMAVTECWRSPHEDQNVRAWVKIVQAMITDLLELNHNLSIIKVVGDVGEEGSYNVFEILYRYFEHFVEGDSVFGIWLKSNPATWLFKKAGYMHVHPGASHGMRAAFLCRQIMFTDSVLKQKKSGRQPISMMTSGTTGTTLSIRPYQITCIMVQKGTTFSVVRL